MAAGSADAVVDARQEFFDDYITRALAANLMYEHKYPAFTALARPAGPPGRAAPPA